LDREKALGTHARARFSPENRVPASPG
jgi:hypothetical protein